MNFSKLLCTVLCLTSAYTLSAQSKMTFTTSKSTGETLSLSFDAPTADQSNIWIDLNNNSIQEDNEGITAFGMDTLDYTITNQTITIYGNVTGFNCSSSKITDLNVSENPVLEKLICDYNNLESIDLSNNSALKVLWCDDNSLESLDVSNNPNLEILWCEFNSLEGLDVSNNSALKELLCGFNYSISELDITNNPNLEYLWCASNGISELNTSNNPLLKELFAFGNSLSSLDLSQNTALVEFNCEGNGLTELDLNNHSALEKLWCQNNQLNTLNIDNCNKIKTLICSNNQLTELDVTALDSLKHLNCEVNALTNLYAANGNNGYITEFNAVSNPDLTCIQVDDGFIPEVADGWEKDESAQWNNDSSNPCNGFVEIDEHAIGENTIHIYPNPTSDVLNIIGNDKIQKVELYNSTGELILTECVQQFSIAHLPAGFYVLRVYINNASFSKHVIKQ